MMKIITAGVIRTKIKAVQGDQAISIMSLPHWLFKILSSISPLMAKYLKARMGRSPKAISILRCFNNTQSNILNTTTHHSSDNNSRCSINSLQDHNLLSLESKTAA